MRFVPPTRDSHGISETAHGGSPRDQHRWRGCSRCRALGVPAVPPKLVWKRLHHPRVLRSCLWDKRGYVSRTPHTRNAHSWTGGLITLGLFAKQWPLAQCEDTFSRLTGEIFGAASRGAWSALAGLPYVRLLLNDALYKEAVLDSALQDSFGRYVRVFDYPHNAVSRYKFAVTATNITEASPFIFTNYNGRADRDPQCGTISAAENTPPPLPADHGRLSTPTTRRCGARASPVGSVSLATRGEDLC